MSEASITITITGTFSQTKEILDLLAANKKQISVARPEAKEPAVVQPEKKRKRTSAGPRVCVVCGNTYSPTSNVQKKCPDCKGVKLDKINELDKTLAEIEARRKAPYQIQKPTSV